MSEETTFTKNVKSKLESELESVSFSDVAMILSLAARRSVIRPVKASTLAKYLDRKMADKA